jgi:hypothetical protein
MNQREMAKKSMYMIATGGAMGEPPVADAASCIRALRKKDTVLTRNTQQISPGIALRIAERYRG